MIVYRSAVAAAILYGALLVGCTTPDQPTDLRKDGPPNVTAVTVMSDLKTGVDPSPPLLNRLIETATLCRLNDDKRPGLVGLPDFTARNICPDDLSKGADKTGTAEGAPPNWFARLVFDKLLDPNVEDLVPVDLANPMGVQKGTLARTQPVTLKCNGVDVAYDGYYAPGGSKTSMPPGPSIVIQPVSAVSVQTGATCELGIKDIVHNKKGESVPTEQRAATFKIGPMALRFSSPDPSDDGAKDGTLELDLDQPVLFYFTAAIPTFTAAPASFPAIADIHIFEGTSAAICTADVATLTRVPDADVVADRDTFLAAVFGITSAATRATNTDPIMDLSVGSDPDHFWKPETFYRIEFGSAARMLAAQGGPAATFPAGFKLCFKTTAPPP